MSKISEINIIDGKRKRVMSTDGVLACVTTNLLKTTNQKQGIKQKKPLKQKKKIVIQQESDSSAVQVVEKSQKETEEKVRITKSALTELISQHFLIIDDEEQKQQQPKKHVKHQLRDSNSESSSSDKSSSENIPKRYKHKA
ncbi:unnamed protein product (macronuclear) [Paramecium tetraurelia]|uniref:Uncharacterized protein n=1 Tax=Paramecium tetraurelia TaxID=5888 RepID=A0CM81_PARTE|nr:uncharacterized protein GSPATT00008377001 [Paramecium tetraurelia]CAK71898.1 unnamed protein product [Paramecium tetraurelia]|eukprot:XP_001439295.1 hypothetical protein (macronuclear) [Paramecium tetraurelia strain d4-2]